MVGLWAADEVVRDVCAFTVPLLPERRRTVEMLTAVTFCADARLTRACAQRLTPVVWRRTPGGVSPSTVTATVAAFDVFEVSACRSWAFVTVRSTSPVLFGLWDRLSVSARAVIAQTSTSLAGLSSADVERFVERLDPVAATPLGEIVDLSQLLR